MKKGTDKIFLFVILTVFLVSCGKNVVFTDSVPMKGNIWSIDNIANFSFPVSDTVNSNNISFTIRTGSAYPYRNIFLFVTTKSPGGKSITDTLEYQLANEKGNWNGKGFADIHELDLPYKRNVFFPSSGNWQIMIQHGMRIQDLKGVYDFGVRVERNRKTNSAGGKK